MARLVGKQSGGAGDRWHAVGAGFLGWMLDAFDFFVVIFLFDTLAARGRSFLVSPQSELVA